MASETGLKCPKPLGPHKSIPGVHHRQQQHHQHQQHDNNSNGLACNISEKLGLGPEIRELKLGPTFTNGAGKATAFHTIKYDFKPASVDVSKMATVDVGTNNTMTVTVPHLDGAGTQNTVFKGSHKPYHKECVLIIDKITGEVTLERLCSNIQVKKTRFETKPLLSVPNANSGIRPITPIGTIETRRSPTNGRTKSRTKVASGKKREPSHQLRPKQSPPRASYHGKSPPSTNLPSSTSSLSKPSSKQSTLASLPMIGEQDDFSLSPPASSTVSVLTSHSTAPPRTVSPAVNEKPFVKPPILVNDVGILSDSSSSDSSSDSSDSDSEPEKTKSAKVNGHAANGTKASPSLLTPDHLLSEDLQLSESGSDSD